MTRLEGRIKKGWGFEHIWATNDKYCGKFMHFYAGRKFSMHFHMAKDETWYIASGKFKLILVDTETGKTIEKILNKGDSHRNEPGQPHQLVCLEDGTIIEVSTPDSVEDNYRIAPGDSQK